VSDKTDMLETPRVESPAYLHQEYGTTVNHIVGYIGLLIEEAAERQLEPFIPHLQRIREGGDRLLETIRETFGEQAGGEQAWEGEAFRSSFHSTVLDMSQTLASLDKEMGQADRETFADMDAIFVAARRLLDMTSDVVPYPRQGGAGSILIAAGDASNRELLHRTLLREGHEVVEAANGPEVFEILKDNPCDLILLDILMPDMDGFQTLAKIKHDPRLSEVPVIMISALEDLQSAVRCIEMGADDYLTKTFNRVILRARDALTGLANRRSVEAALDVRVAGTEPFTAVYIDLNGFKKVNHTYGRAAGDELKEVGARLRSAFRSTDAIGRWGGDEFVALVDAEAADVQRLISRLRDVLAEDFIVSGAQHRVAIGAAVGTAAWKPNDTACVVLHRAGFAMYEDKLLTAV
jgi:diguanylate cyclase (GGDEF)-like protein